jgi:hypothetical protein
MNEAYKNNGKKPINQYFIAIFLLFKNKKYRLRDRAKFKRRKANCRTAFSPQCDVQAEVPSAVIWQVQ